MHYHIICTKAHIETITFCKMDKCSNLPHVKYELSTYLSSKVEEDVLLFIRRFHIHLQ